MYISLADVQIEEEEERLKHPLHHKAKPIRSVPRSSLPGHAPQPAQYMIGLLKILLASAPTSKAKTESINILTDVLPDEMPMSVLQSMKLGIDVNRHKEIVVKAVSSILLLLLKHLKLNHIYQFEYTSQQLMFANCIPLVLKFFNQNITNYEIGDQQGYCWRNLFSCINLLRVLNKLTKWKHSRIMVVMTDAGGLQISSHIEEGTQGEARHAPALRPQAAQDADQVPGRQWRKTNMKTISAIYQKVRHRLNDDWAFGNARYDRSGGAAAGPDLEPVDNNFLSVLGRDIELTAEFKTNYERWLAREVFQVSVDWDQLLNPATCQP
ncbi:STRIP2 [Cordylochernes scorpioides]|uniref:STRIP2 n=1 Tax=Cordylochernes scorpioides TaxID=51811 RepID=A0ABY6L5Q0_9ARAC|nr:STRIP2 [Cordylochernes scorpioides]